MSPLHYRLFQLHALVGITVDKVNDPAPLPLVLQPSHSSTKSGHFSLITLSVLPLLDAVKRTHPHIEHGLEHLLLNSAAGITVVRYSLPLSIISGHWRRTLLAPNDLEYLEHRASPILTCQPSPTAGTRLDIP